MITTLIPGTTSVILNWTQSSMDVVDSYTISYSRTVGCTEASPGSTTTTGSPYTLMGLQEDTTYEISITAMNSGGSRSTMATTTTLSASEK